MLDLVSSPFGLIAIGAFLCIGFVVGRLIESARRKVVAGGFCLAVPVFLAGLAYLSAGSDGCGGGDCGGALFIIAFLLLFLVPIALVGLGLLFEVLITAAISSMLP